MGIPVAQQRLMVNGTPLLDQQTLLQSGLKNGDIVTVTVVTPSQARGIPMDARQVQEYFRSQPQLLEELLVVKNAFGLLFLLS